jgi:transcription antitermination factor NusA-like protein
MIRSFLFIANRPGDYDRIAVVSRTEMEGKIGYCGQKKRFENNKTEKQTFSYAVLIYF